MAVEKGEHQEPFEAPRATVRLIRLSPMSEQFVRIKASARDIHLVDVQDTLAGRHQAMVAQGTVETVSRIFFNTKMVNL